MLDELHSLTVALLERVVALQTAGKPPEPLLTLEQAAERLCVSRTTVQELVDRGELPCVEVTGRAIRVDPRDIEAFLKAKRVRRAG